MKNIPLIVVALIACTALAVALIPPPPPVAPKAAVAPPAAPLPDPKVAVLEREVADLTTQVGDLRQRLDRTTSASAGAVAPGVADDDHIKQVVDDELKAQMARFRPPGGFGGRQQQDPATIQKDLVDKVGVDADTSVKLQEMVTASRTTIMDAIRGGNTPRDQIPALVQSEKAKVLAQAGAILNPDQTTKFNDWLEQQIARGQRGMRGGPGGGGPGGPPDAPPGGPDGGATAPGVKF